MNEVIIRYLDMDPKIKGLTVKDSNDDYNVYINPRLSDAERQKTVMHETDHIENDHFYDVRPVKDLESDIKPRNP